MYLNGAFIPREQAVVDVEDRGFLFADGVYEVIYVRQGVPLFLGPHMDRLWRSAAGIDLRLPFDRPALERVFQELIKRHPAEAREATIYLQVTRGTSPRTHTFPDPYQPTVFAMLRPFQTDPEVHRDGVAVITAADERWLHPEIKSVSLLPNVLASERARRAGAYEAVLVRDGVVTEGSHSNFGIVHRGEAITHPLSPLILAGITRQVVLEAARAAAIPFVERPFGPAELAEAEEAFLTGTTGGVVPVVRVDGRPVGDGRPGPVTRRLMEVYAQAMEREIAAAG